MSKAIIFIIMVSISLAGCADQTTKPNSSPGEYEEARAVYKAHCISCHASDLSGLVGEASNLQHVGSRLTEEQIIQTIKQGKGLMQPFQDKLADEDIARLAAWLAEQR